MNLGGEDSCEGDSGGPLVVQVNKIEPRFQEKCKKKISTNKRILT